MGARSLRLRLVLTLGALGSMLLWSSSASASLTHKFLSSFAPFANTRSVAVDQSTGDVYVLDAGTGSLYKYSSTGVPAEFSALKADVIEGVGASSELGDQVAVDSSAGPAKGDIYVANGSQVKIYANDGGSLGEITAEAGKPWGQPCGVAVDQAGHVYVGLYPNEANPSSSVNQYAPAANPVKDSDYASSLKGLNGVCDVAVDSTGGVYAVTWSEGPVMKYEALQFGALQASGTEIPGGRIVAVDPATDEVYVGASASVNQYDSSGNLLGATTGERESKSFGESWGVAVNAETGHLYVADGGNSRIDIFGPSVVIPDVTTGEAANPATTTATLTGTVDPGGALVTGCQFEYGGIHGEEGAESFEGFVHVASCVTGPGSGNGAVEVTAQVSGLEPNVLYSYRLVATNANGVVEGQSVQFRTLSPPLIDREFPVEVHTTTATLSAQINPKGYAATYRFEYGASTSYGTSVPVPDAAIAASGEDQTVAQSIGGLQPGATYHYRVVASSVNGATEGPDRVLRTASPPVSVVDSCPDAQVRQMQFSSYLPDCRAYELVSPADKEGASIAADATMTQSAVDGDAVKFYSTAAFADAVGLSARGAEYVSKRGIDGWVTHRSTPSRTT